jgi:hypothetical protein
LSKNELSDEEIADSTDKLFRDELFKELLTYIDEGKRGWFALMIGDMLTEYSKKKAKINDDINKRRSVLEKEKMPEADLRAKLLELKNTSIKIHIMNRNDQAY